MGVRPAAGRAPEAVLADLQRGLRVAPHGRRLLARRAAAQAVVHQLRACAPGPRGFPDARSPPLLALTKAVISGNAPLVRPRTSTRPACSLCKLTSAVLPSTDPDHRFSGAERIGRPRGQPASPTASAS